MVAVWWRALGSRRVARSTELVRARLGVLREEMAGQAGGGKVDPDQVDPNQSTGQGGADRFNDELASGPVGGPARGAVGGLAGGLARWLPPGAVRLVAPRSAAAGLVGVAVLAAMVTGLVLYWLRPRAAPVGPPPLVAAAVMSPGGDHPAGPSVTVKPQPLVLAVVGRVRHPGLVTVPAGARLVDALRAAGGALPGVDLTLLNLARRVVDGEQIVVGTGLAGTQPGATGPAGSEASGSIGPVNLNTATLTQLDALPGVGPVIAQRILDWRAAHGGFATVEQLREVDGIGELTFGRLRDKVTV